MDHSWRDIARPIIARVIAEVGRDDPQKLRQAIRNAYPFGERKHWPYKAWLNEVRAQCGRLHAMPEKDQRQLDMFGDGDLYIGAKNAVFFPADQPPEPQLDPFPDAGKALGFDGPSYDPKHDQARLKGQLLRVYVCMRCASLVWLTLNEIAERTGDPPASISAQLRHLRKPRFGAHVILKRRRGQASKGLWEYRLEQNKKPGEMGA